MRGAYAAGVLRGITEVLALSASDRPPFTIFSGTSIGAINASYLAANAHRGDLATDGLVSMWTSIDVKEFLHVRPFAVVPSLFRRGKEELSHSLLDPEPLEKLVKSHDQWDELHANIASGRARALIVAALDASSGLTTLFCECAPDAGITTTTNPYRTTVLTTITPDHLLASSAIPVLFPPRRIGDRLYFDGGLRYNTPISPTIRAGADKLVVISLASPEEGERQKSDEGAAVADGPGLVFLLGKLLNTLVLDPIDYDLQVLDRTNALARILDDEVTPTVRAKIDAQLAASRGAPYRVVENLVFRPSTDLGKLAARYLREVGTDFPTDFVSRMVLKRAATADVEAADWATFLLFDGRFAERLVQAGRDDAHARAKEIEIFFGDVV